MKTPVAVWFLFPKTRLTVAPRPSVPKTPQSQRDQRGPLGYANNVPGVFAREDSPASSPELLQGPEAWLWPPQ